MLRLSPLLALLALPAFAQVTAVGDIVIVQDTSGSITNGMFRQSTFCSGAYNAMRSVYPDIFDGIVSFSASDDFMEMENTWQGTPVRAAASGIGRGARAGDLLPNLTTYNGQKLSECVFMGTLGHTQGLIPGLPGAEPLPMNPDDITRAFGGLFPHLTGIEMVGHEYGHHWMLGVMYDKNDGRGPQDLLRGYEEDSNGGGTGGGTGGSANQHYNAKSNSGSVMYGNCLRPLDGGVFELSGCARKFNELDQYLMGLRLPSEVSPLLVLDDGSGHGDPAQPMTRGATLTVSGTPVWVSVDDVIRAEGPRVPGRGTGAQSCWRVAFVVVLPPGVTTTPPAMLQKVQNYQARFGPWFNAATDGRGVMDTRLTGNGCVATDGGVVNLDAGVPDAGVLDAGERDAGAPDAGEPDAGEPDAGEPDAAVEDAGVEDAGAEEDGGQPPSKWETVLPHETGKIRPGCGCDGGSAGTGSLLAFAALLVFARRRRSERGRASAT